MSDVSRYSFGSVDLVASNEFTEHIDGEGLFMAGPGLGYGIYSVTLVSGEPVRLDTIVVNSSYGVSVGVADFTRNRWNWLATGVSRGAHLELSADALGPDDQFLVAFVATGLEEAWDWVVVTTVAVVTDNDDPGDEEPPVWTDEVGVTSADGSHPLISVNHGEATDLGTAPEPVAYVVYAAPTFAGIDWTRPIDIFVDMGGSPSVSEYWTSSTMTDVAVRAMDAKGNLTQNTDTFSFYLPYETGEPVDNMPGAVWRAGDKVVMRWDNPADDFGFGVLNGPLEGDAEFPWADDPFVTSPENTDAGVAEEWVSIQSGAPEGTYTIEVRADTDGTAVLEVQHADGSVTYIMDVALSSGWAGDVAYLYYRAT